MPTKDVGYLIKNINDKLKAKADADMKRFNLTFTQSRVLAFLHEKGGQATQKEIEVFLDVSHPTVVGIISRMEQNEYVESWLDDRDKRNKIVQLTLKAMELGTEMERHMRENEQILLASMSAEEQEALKRLLMMVYNNLE